MIIITLTLRGTCEPIDIVIGSNTAYSDNWIQNGSHDNGGYKVIEDIVEIKEKIKEQQELNYVL